MTDFSDDPDLTREFVSESMDMLDLVEPQLLEMSKNIDAESFDKEIVNSIFRLFHTLKGSAGFMNLSVVQAVSHQAENLLDLVRTGHRLSDRHMDLLIRTTDFIRDLMAKIEVENNDEMAKEEGESLVSELAGAAKDVDAQDVAAPASGEAAATQPTPTEEAGEAAATQPPAEATGAGEGDRPAGTMEFQDQFAAEAAELLDEAEKKIFVLKKTPDNEEALQDLLRVVHTFKGNCGFMGFADLEKISHGIESILEQFKQGTLEVTGRNLDLLLSIQGLLQQTIAKIRTGGPPEINNAGIYLDMLGDALAPSGVKTDEPAEGSPGGAVQAAQPNHGANAPGGAEAAAAAHDNPTPRHPPPDGSQAVAVEPAGSSPPGYGRRKTDPLDIPVGRHPTRQDIRVNVEKLDSLFDLVGELIIAESMVTHNPELDGYEFSGFEKAARHLTKITRELHDISMLVRMIPVSGAFQKMNRLVHDLSRKSGKQMDLVLVGEETEVDKTVVEMISDPLIHLIRNAADHGLEENEERLAAGKSEKGTITIEARHEGQEVWIVVQDDGKGLDRKKLIDKGIERGLVNGNGSEMSDSEVFALIFEPGFSTAKEVTNVSGRGVGMDVVKRNIEKIKGRVEIQSAPGKGTKFTIRIPLTLAIIEGMLVRVAGSQYTVPILSMKETIKVQRSQIVTTADGQEYVKIRGTILPCLRLYELHTLKPDYDKLEDGVLLILEHQDQTFGLLIDELIGLHQTVVKGLSGYLSRVRGISGYTILGNGDVSLILDPGSLLEIAETKKTTIAS